MKVINKIHQTTANMSGDFLKSSQELKDRHDYGSYNVRKQGEITNPFNVSSTLEASPEATSYSVVQRVPRLLFSVHKRNIEKHFRYLIISINFSMFYLSFQAHTKLKCTIVSIHIMTLITSFLLTPTLQLKTFQTIPTIWPVRSYHEKFRDGDANTGPGQSTPDLV